MRGAETLKSIEVQRREGTNHHPIGVRDNRRGGLPEGRDQLSDFVQFIRKAYAGLMPSEMKRQGVLEQDNARLHKIVGYLSLNEEFLQEVVKRKHWGLPGRGHLSTRCVRIGRCRSAGLAR